MTRNTALRLLALLLTALLFRARPTDAELGIGDLFVGWGLSTVLLGKLLVVLFGSGRVRYPRRRPVTSGPPQAERKTGKAPARLMLINHQPDRQQRPNTKEFGSSADVAVSTDVTFHSRDKD